MCADCEINSDEVAEVKETPKKQKFFSLHVGDWVQDFIWFTLSIYWFVKLCDAFMLGKWESFSLILNCLLLTFMVMMFKSNEKSIWRLYKNVTDMYEGFFKEYQAIADSSIKKLGQMNTLYAQVREERDYYQKIAESVEKARHLKVKSVKHTSKSPNRKKKAKTVK